MSQISKWTLLTSVISTAPTFHGLDTPAAMRAYLRLRKIENYVELWAQLTLSGVVVDQVNPTITVDLTGDTFLSAAAAQDVANWTRDAATSGLTFGAITWVSTTRVTMATLGTALAGVFRVLVKKAALAADVYDSGNATFNISTQVSSYTIAPEIFAATSISVGAVNPTLRIVVNNDAFLSQAAVADLTNWTIGVGATALTFASVVWINDRTADLTFSGTAAAGTLTIAIAADALIGKTAGVSIPYVIDAAEWGGTYTVPVFAGAIEVHQTDRGCDVPAFCKSVAVTDGTEAGNCVAVPLIAESSAFSPRSDAQFTYIYGAGPEPTGLIYAQLVLDS